MTLRVLIIEEEPAFDISDVILESEEQAEEEDLDLESPGDFTLQDDLDLLEDSASDLEAIGTHIACEGMDVATARKLDMIDPNFIRRNGGISSFTAKPSLEGLSDAVNTVKAKLAAIFKKLREFIINAYKKFLTWIDSKKSQPESQNIEQEVEEFLAARRNRDAISYIASLPDDVEESAAQVARFMDGDTKEFASAFGDQLQGLAQRVEAVEKMMLENPTYFRVARGMVSVVELFKQDADSTINELLQKAAEVANAALLARNNAQMVNALLQVTSITEELQNTEKEMVLNDQASSEFGDDKSMPFDKLFDNVFTAVKDMNRVDVQSMASKMRNVIAKIVVLSEGVKSDDILEMIPDDVPEDQRAVCADKIIKLYRAIAAIGGKVLRLWKMRYNSVASINKVMLAMIEIVDGFESGVVSSGRTLTPEQKTQLAKALAGKGFRIAF